MAGEDRNEIALTYLEQNRDYIEILSGLGEEGPVQASLDIEGVIERCTDRNNTVRILACLYLQEHPKHE